MYLSQCRKTNLHEPKKNYYVKFHVGNTVFEPMLLQIPFINSKTKQN